MPRRCYASPAVWYSAFKTSSTTSDSTQQAILPCASERLGEFPVVEFVWPGTGHSRDVHWSSAETGNHSVEELKASSCWGGGYWE